MSEQDFNKAYEVLEIGRDEFENLGKGEKRALNDAHCILQEMEMLEARGIETLQEYK